MTTTQTQFLSELKALLRKHNANLVSMDDGEMHVYFDDGDYLNLNHRVEHWFEEPSCTTTTGPAGDGSFLDDKFYPSA